MKDTDKRKLLLVEDEHSVGSVVKARLEKAGYIVVWSKDGEEGLHQMRGDRFAMVLLDMNMPRLTGMEFLQIVRKEKYTQPILILSADRLLEDRVKALKAGADDYLVKPFDFEEVLARIEAHLRRTEHVAPQMLHCGDIHVDLKERTIHLGDQKLEVSDIEFRLMEYFVKQPDTALPRTQIAKEIWGHENYSESNVIDVYLGYLISALEKAGRPGLIKETANKDFIISSK